MDEKKYYWIIYGNYYEVPKETYQKLKKNYDHAKLLKEYEAEVTVLSLDAFTSEELTLEEMVSDPEVNVEEAAVHNVLLESMRTARNSLSPDEKLLLELLFDQSKSQDEAAKITGIPQRTISYRLEKILNKMRKIMGVKK
ncbi:MAG: sigma-70 family RNA polymerase sigma factor [Clostridia bacterium]|nr:sigma-70 family RNA polymerase sigma factor [Clostridia bacterium]